MNINEFDYDLPENLIAQTPLRDRTSSRMLVTERTGDALKHDKFSNLLKYVKPGDCLVLNNSKVIPVRLFGRKEETGANIEILLLHERDHPDEWEALVRPARKIKVGDTIDFGDGTLVAKCTGEKDAGGRILTLSYEGVFLEVLDQLGEMPLPPYIKEKLQDDDRYQTVYAKEAGSAAAPTAGLHFTDELLGSLKDAGVKIAYVTLHVGLGTFRPVTADFVEEHEMHAEYYELSEENARILNETKAAGGHIIAVGTTATRVLETVFAEINKFTASSGWTDIYIYPPYDFKAIDGLITNFHLPKSSLLLLISAFTNKAHIFKTYEAAIKEDYRFFSFGDAMFILPQGYLLD